MQDLEPGPVPLRGSTESLSLIVERLCPGEQWALRLDGWGPQGLMCKRVPLPFLPCRGLDGITAFFRVVISVAHGQQRPCQTACSCLQPSAHPLSFLPTTEAFSLPKWKAL